MLQDEFYIGWSDRMPKGFAVTVKWYLLAMLLVASVLGIMLAASQKRFSTGTFEFGTLTEVKGIYRALPVPSLRVSSGTDFWGNDIYVTIPLIGYGKHGAAGIMADLSVEAKTQLGGKEITLKGTLLYNDGKLLMQVDEGDKPLLHIENVAVRNVFSQQDLGEITTRGEIVDPKCFFGVMKPGEGKPHKDCAVRCILGGIPPMLKVTDHDGRQNYYLLAGDQGDQLNEKIAPFVARPVEIHARAVKDGDWIVLYPGKTGGVREISRTELFQPAGTIVSCATGF